MRASQVFEHVTAVFIAGAEIACTGTSEGQAGHFNFAESGHFYGSGAHLVILAPAPEQVLGTPLDQA